jgi:N,N'-diacetyllegionaminate synthase
MSGPPTLIAELCQNHQGDRGLLRDMVHAASEAGADYAKIQALYSADLTRRARFDIAVPTDASGSPLALRRPYAAEVARLRQLDLSPDDEAFFVETCETAGIRPLVTVFTRAAIPRLAKLGFPAVKIASYDCASYPLLRDVAQNWTEIIVSTGAMFPREIARTVTELSDSSLTLLHCVSLYPTALTRLNLARLSWLRTLVPRVGLSDHTLVAQDGVWASKAALALGASVIERHFTVLGPDQTKDGPVSITPDDLADLRRFGELPIEERRAVMDRDRPDWTTWIGVPDATPGPDEIMNRDFYAGRVASWVNGRPVFNWEDVDLAVYAAYPDLTTATPTPGD